MNRLTGILALILAVSLAAPATADAQEAATAPAGDPTQISGTWINGVKGGANWGTLGGDTTDDVGTHLGANVGYFFSYRLGMGLAVQPEILVSEKGAPDAVFNQEGRNADIIATYIDVPVLGRYNVPMAGEFKPYGYLGPVLSYNIDARRMVATDGTDFEDEISDFDAGFAVGAGCDWYAGKETGMTLDARFSMGLLNALEDDPNDRNVKHRVISVMFGIWK